MKTIVTTASFFGALAFGLSGIATAQTFTSYPINIPGLSYFQATGINDSGETVLNYTDGAFMNHCLLLAGKTLTHIDDPNEVGTGRNRGTSCWGINNSGEVVGGYTNLTGGNGFIYNAGVYTDVIIPTATGGTTASGINNVGQVVGTFYDNAGYHGFLYTVSSGAWQQLDVPGALASTSAVGINDAGTITLTNGTGLPSSSVLYKGKYISLNVPGALLGTYIGGINVHGWIVLTAQDSHGVHGYLYRGGKFTQFDVANAASTQSFGINDQGVIVGDFSPKSAPYKQLGYYGYF
jgi:hypothetical protein